MTCCDCAPGQYPCTSPDCGARRENFAGPYRPRQKGTIHIPHDGIVSASSYETDHNGYLWVDGYAWDRSYGYRCVPHLRHH